MLYYDRIGISDGINVNKASASKECYLSLVVFLDKGFKFQSDVCSEFHDV